ncbi:MAG: mitochondrial fusion and transport protein ugo1 [Caeruleum heppii]|nr:MAG: mitochondrial fusion and transport protein ugo1 [Caeruleum heppii]
MTTHREGPNPLRPYYIPPSIGPPPTSSSSAANTSAPRVTTTVPTSSKPSLSSSARDLISDLDYHDYLSSSDTPSATVLLKKVLDQALWRYTSVLLAQPFENAKTILQVRLAGEDHGDDIIPRKRPVASRKKSGNTRRAVYDEPSDDDSDPDEPMYFTSNTPTPHPSHPHRRNSQSRLHARLRRSPSPSPPPTPTHPTSTSASSPHTLHIHPSSLLSVISQLYTHEGLWGVWKASNTTFILSVLTKTLESLTRGLLAAVLNVPDPGVGSIGGTTGIGGVDLGDSPWPFASLGVAVAAAGIAGIILAPIDMVRTRLILTPTSHPPRSLLPTLRSLPTSSTLPLPLLPITLLHSTLPTLLSTSTPLLLRRKLGVDPVLTPTSFSIAMFLGQVLELGVRLPIETVLRRGQAAFVLGPESTKRKGRASRKVGRVIDAEEEAPVDTVVPLGPFYNNGILSTMYHIVFEEGSRRASNSSSPSSHPNKPSSSTTPNPYTDLPRPKDPSMRQTTQRKGQGLEGLWQGWRVGMWGLVGVWGAGAIGGGGKGGEF